MNNLVDSQVVNVDEIDKFLGEELNEIKQELGLKVSNNKYVFYPTWNKFLGGFRTIGRFVIIGFVFATFIFDEFIREIMIILSFLVIFIIVLEVINSLKSQDSVWWLNHEVDKIIYPRILKTMGINGYLYQYKTFSDEYRTKVNTILDKSLLLIAKLMKVPLIIQTKELKEVVGKIWEDLSKSRLITETFNSSMLDSIVILKHDDKEVTVSELDLKWRHKRSEPKTIFKGHFVTVKLNKGFEGETHINREDDIELTSHLSKETILEWSEFERNFRVSTTDEIGARQVLTPDFMLALQNWWPDGKYIRVSFIRDYLYILIPEDKIRIHETISDVSTEEISAYIRTVYSPLINIMNFLKIIKI